MIWCVLASKICEDVLCLTRTCFTGQQSVERSLIELCDQILQAGVIHGWDEDACEWWIAVRRICVHRHNIYPLLPLTLVVDEVVVDEIVLVLQLRHV